MIKMPHQATGDISSGKMPRKNGEVPGRHVRFSETCLVWLAGRTQLWNDPSQNNSTFSLHYYLIEFTGQLLI
jgi:hypothetical protein